MLIWVFINIFGFSLKTKNYNQLKHILYNKEQYMLYIRHVYQTTAQFHKKFENLKILPYCNVS